tara:strand:- start:1630 stop:2478 length:849 start_codon:yes stop_codon:yes gene_type:complete
MSRLFKRKAQVIIGKLGSKGRLLDGVRISFDIDMDDNRETNTGKVNIYNLSEETIGLLEQKDVSVILKIGYDGEELSTLFIGNVVEYERDFNGSDVVTKITLKDGYIPLTNKKLSLSFAENSNTKQIIEKIVGELNLAKSDYSLLPNYIYKQGFSFIGAPGTALDIILARIGYQWIIVNNVLIITKPNESNKQVISQFLSPQTGLIDKPKRFKEKSVKTKTKDNKLIDGWKINSLIIPSIQPKNLIKVESSEIKGIFLVKSVRFNGDTEDSKWLCKIQAIQK